ncbi:MAG: leucyl aminopeptidase [Pirellulaceae bacterium]
MKISPISTSPSNTEADAVIVTLPQDGAPTSPVYADPKLTELVVALMSNREFEGKLCETLVVPRPAGFAAPLLVLVGLGNVDSHTSGHAFRLCATAARAISNKLRSTVALFADAQWSPKQKTHAIAGLCVGSQGNNGYRQEPNRYPFDQIWCAGFADDICERGQVLGESVNLARTLVNEPPSHLYPETFIERMQALAADGAMSLEIWDEHKLHAENCRSLLAVAQGSARPPRLGILRYQGTQPDGHWLTLVGKGVTFDSGGLSLKPSESMKTMKCDMGGAAAVVGALHAASRLKLPVNVMGLVGLVENMPSANAYKLGDVVTARNGKTIEVLNTDAEGRMVLADVLDVAVEYGADRIIDLATLTGACVVALGQDVAGVMTNDQDWCDSVLECSQECGEFAWQLPMFAEYREQIRSDIADIKNVGNGRWGGAITAAKFLEEFVGNVPWVHIDIAGPAYLDRPNAMLDAGGSGVMVRTLTELIARHAT